MADGLIQQHRTENSAGTLNLNQAANTVLATFFFPRKVTVLRYGVISEASEGLLAVGVLNLAIAVQGGATAVEITGQYFGGAYEANFPGGAGIFHAAKLRKLCPLELLALEADPALEEIILKKRVRL